MSRRFAPRSHVALAALALIATGACASPDASTDASGSSSTSGAPATSTTTNAGDGSSPSASAPGQASPSGSVTTGADGAVTSGGPASPAPSGSVTSPTIPAPGDGKEASDVSFQALDGSISIKGASVALCILADGKLDGQFDGGGSKISVTASKEGGLINVEGEKKFIGNVDALEVNGEKFKAEGKSAQGTPFTFSGTCPKQ